VTERILIVDDDVRLATMVGDYLSSSGFAIERRLTGLDGLNALERENFDAVVLDVMLPDIDGFEVCRRLRARSSVPILMLTAKGDETDRVVGLEIGADDYVPKPFSPRELLARLRAVLRRSAPEAVSEKLAVADVQVDVGSRQVTVEGKEIDLTGLEFDILVALMRRAGRVIPRDALLAEAGRSDVVVGERTVDVHISHLRAKLGDDPRAPRRIKTVRGVGYVLSREQ